MSYEHSIYWRHGFADAVMQRPCKSPLPQDYKHIRMNAEYIAGFMEGESRMCLRCNHCGLPVNLALEPQANRRDMVLIICDMCAAIPDTKLAALPVMLYQAPEISQ